MKSMKKICCYLFIVIMMFLVACGKQNLNKENTEIKDGQYTEGYGKPIQVKIDECGGMILFENGSLYTFGAPNDMPLGRKNKDYHLTKILEDIVDIEIGDDMAFAVDKKGQLWGWRAENNSPWKGFELEEMPKVLTKDVKDVAACDSIVIIKNDNSAWIWGSGTEACNSKDGFARILKDVKQVDITSRFGVAIKNDNTMWVWGDFEWPKEFSDIQEDVPALYGSGITFATAHQQAISYLDEKGYHNIISFGEEIVKNNDKKVTRCNYLSSVENGMYLTQDKKLYVWGKENAYGQFGMGISSWDGGVDKIEFLDAQIVLEGIIDYDMTGYTAIALDQNGYVYVWGQNMNHILGMEDTEAKAIPTVLYRP